MNKFESRSLLERLIEKNSSGYFKDLISDTVSSYVENDPNRIVVLNNNNNNTTSVPNYKVEDEHDEDEDNTGVKRDRFGYNISVRNESSFITRGNLQNNNIKQQNEKENIPFEIPKLNLNWQAVNRGVDGGGGANDFQFKYVNNNNRVSPYFVHEGFANDIYYFLLSNISMAYNEPVKLWEMIKNHSKTLSVEDIGVFVMDLLSNEELFSNFINEYMKPEVKDSIYLKPKNNEVKDDVLYGHLNNFEDNDKYDGENSGESVGVTDLELIAESHRAETLLQQEELRNMDKLKEQFTFPLEFSHVGFQSFCKSDYPNMLPHIQVFQEMKQNLKNWLQPIIQDLSLAMLTMEANSNSIYEVVSLSDKDILSTLQATQSLPNVDWKPTENYLNLFNSASNDDPVGGEVMNTTEFLKKSFIPN